MIKYIYSFLILFNTLIAQTNIDHMRDLIAEINICFADSILPKQNTLKELNESILEAQNNLTQEHQILNFINELNKFNSMFINKDELDSLKYQFRNVKNQFNSIYGEYFHSQLNNSTKLKIILLSTSVSCDCTLELCYEQEIEIEKLYLKLNKLFDYAVVDTWINNEIQEHYKAGFSPTVIVIGENGKEKKRWVREEDLFKKLENEIL